MERSVMEQRYRTLTDEEAAAVALIKEKLKEAFDLIDRNGHGYKAVMAKRRIEEASMWATASITG